MRVTFLWRVDVIVTCVLAYLTPSFVFAFQTESWDGMTSDHVKEQRLEESQSQLLVCEEQQVRSHPGTYSYFSLGQKRYCSLYVAAPVDHVIDLEFTYFDVTCDDDGEVLLLDGWELDYEVFPSISDHPHSLPMRLVPLCNPSSLSSPSTSSSSSSSSSSPSSSSSTSSSMEDALNTLEAIETLGDLEGLEDLEMEMGHVPPNSIQLEEMQEEEDVAQREQGEDGRGVAGEREGDDVLPRTISPLGRVFTAQQNVAQIQFIIPRLGQGFSVKVTFRKNHKPCNMILLHPHYERITLRNYGMRRNCTVMSMYPQRVRFLYVNVGQKVRNPLLYPLKTERHNGLRTMCERDQGTDSVQLYQGTGIGATGSRLVLGFCGVRRTMAPRAVQLRCHSSFLRLESSGLFYNMVQFSFLPTDHSQPTVC